jgi:CDP-glucose 4,6-dehydratase
MMFGNIYLNKKVLITGHTGFKGSWLTSWFLELGAEVAGYSNGIPTTPSHFEELGLAGEIKNYIGDIRDYERLNSVFRDFKPEFVFHLAAQPLVRYSYEEPKETFEVNILGTLNILECIRESRDLVKVGIIITSDKCYDNIEWVYGYRENDALGGEDPYSGSKGAAELVAKSYIKSYFKEGVFPRIATVRAGNVIGGGDWAKDRIVPDIVRSWSQGCPVIIRNPESTRPWQHVLEPLSGYLCLGADLYASETNAGEPFNFGPDSTVNKNVKELINEMELYWDNSPGYDIQQAERNKKESNLLKLTCDKANIFLNWYPNLDFSTTIRFTTDWYNEFYMNKLSVFDLTCNQIKEYVERAKMKKLKWAQK